MILTIYLVGVLLNLVLTIVEESKFKKPIWYLVYYETRKKDTWWALLDKVLFIVFSWFSYVIYGVMYYIQNWRT